MIFFLLFFLYRDLIAADLIEIPRPQGQRIYETFFFLFFLLFHHVKATILFGADIISLQNNLIVFSNYSKHENVTENLTEFSNS